MLQNPNESLQPLTLSKRVSFVLAPFFCLLVSFHAVGSFHIPMRTASFPPRYLARWNPQHRFRKTLPTSRLFSTTNRDIPSNQDLVQKRIEVARAKKAAWKSSVQETQQRHLHVKKLIQNEDPSAKFQLPALYALKISVCDDLRRELHLTGRERRGRVFIEVGSPATRSLKSLKYDIHAFFRALRRSSFVLSACLPEIAPDGSLLEPDDSNMTTTTRMWKIEEDQDVEKTFAMADAHFLTAKESLKRPSVVVHLTKDPFAPPPPPPPAYLESMPDPATSDTMTMLSFYSFPPSGIEHPEDFAMSLKKLWKPFAALGRVYVATEGLNAQMSVPTNM
jgi:UPF0176 acylphosphatase like domain